MIKIFKKNCKYLRNTQIIWLKKFSHGTEDFGNAVDIDLNNNIISVGNSFDGEKYRSKIIKYEQNSTMLWNKTYDNGKQNMVYDVTVDSNDNIIAVGFEGEWTPDPLPDANAYIIKYDKNGTILWRRSFKRGFCTIGFGVTSDSEDNIYLTSTFFIKGEPNLACWTIKCDKNGKQIWNRHYHEHYMDIPHGITVDSMDNIVVVGYAYAPFKHKGHWNAGFLSIKYNKNGNLLWQKRFKSIEAAEAFDVVVDSHDNIIIVGCKSNNPYIIKTDKNGNILWKKIYKTKNIYMPYGVAVNSKDDIIIGGTSKPSKNPKGFILVYDKNGELKWIKKSNINRTVFDITIDHRDAIITVGTIIGSTEDFYVLKEIPK